MKLHEIITANENPTQSILIEELVKYKKQLYVYYSRYFSSEPALMVTDVMNAAQYGRIEPANEMDEAICAYLDDYDCQNEDSENFCEYETICANSMMLKDL